MMEFQGENGFGHTVIVTGIEVENGVQYLKYYDPTTKKPGRRVVGDYSTLYLLSCTSNSSGSSYSSSSGSSSSNISSSESSDDYCTIGDSSSSGDSTNGNNIPSDLGDYNYYDYSSYA
jgi:hypothetical protein